MMVLCVLDNIGVLDNDLDQNGDDVSVVGDGQPQAYPNVIDPRINDIDPGRDELTLFPFGSDSVGGTI